MTVDADPYRRVLVRAAWAWLLLTAAFLAMSTRPWKRFPPPSFVGLSASETLHANGLAVSMCGATWVGACAFLLLFTLTSAPQAPLSPDRARAIAGALSALIALGHVTWGLPFLCLWARALSVRTGYWFYSAVFGPRVELPFWGYTAGGAGFTAEFRIALVSYASSVALLVVGLPVLLSRAHRAWPSQEPPAFADDSPRFRHAARWQLAWAALGVMALASPWGTQEYPPWNRLLDAVLLVSEGDFPGIRLTLIGLLVLLARAAWTLIVSRGRADGWRPTTRWGRWLWHPFTSTLACLLWGLAVVFWWDKVLLRPSWVGVFAVAWLGATLSEAGRALIPAMALRMEPAPGPERVSEPDPLAVALRRAAWVRLRILALAFVTLLLPWGALTMESIRWEVQPATAREILTGAKPMTEMPGLPAVVAGLVALACMSAWEVLWSRHPVSPPSSHAWVFAGWLWRLLLGLPLVALWAIGHSSFSSPLFTMETCGRALNLVLCGTLAVLLLGHLPFEIYRALRARAACQLELHRRPASD